MAAPRTPAPARAGRAQVAPQRIKKPSPVVKKAAPVVEAPAEPVRYFLLAETEALADSTAVHEWGWERSKTGWTTQDGRSVKFLADYDALLAEAHKKGPAIGVFAGYRWYAVTAPHLLDGLVKAGSVVKLDTPPDVA
ncbi:MAG: hypothetical protein WCP82_10075 [Alphaproteobacteria bacterium]